MPNGLLAPSLLNEGRKYSSATSKSAIIQSASNQKASGMNDRSLEKYNLPQSPTFFPSSAFVLDVQMSSSSSVTTGLAPSVATSNSKQRQNSAFSDDFSRYEFVDYTSVSNFERFITHIEETLYSWGIKEGSFGVFSKEQLASAAKATAHASAINAAADFLTRQETIALGEELFQFTYHYHPGQHHIDDDVDIQGTKDGTENNKFASGYHFYQFNSSSSQGYHPLHRWTGQQHLMIIRPIQEGSLRKKIFKSSGRSSIDLSSAKLLVSACAIAFQNTGCRVPIFAPVGQERHDMYIGYKLTNQGQQRSDTTKIEFDTEIKYNMTLMTPPLTHMSSLDGLTALFLQKLCVHRENNGNIDEIDVAKDIDISAVYTYKLTNWFDENWKDWENIIEKASKRRMSFNDDFDSWGDSWGDEEDNEKEAEEGEEEANSQIEASALFPLSFGSYNDPLRSLTLSALFPLTEHAKFHQLYTQPLNASVAKEWLISREFAPINQQRAYLSTLLEQIINSWINDPTNRDYLAPYDENNDESTSDSAKLLHNLFVPGHYRNTSGVSSHAMDINSDEDNDIDDPTSTISSSIAARSAEVESVLTALFDSNEKHIEREHINNRDGKRTPLQKKFDDTNLLGLKLKNASSVPYQSFLWNLILYSLQASAFNNPSASPSNNSNTPSSHHNLHLKKQISANNNSVTQFMAFFRIVWLEVLRQIRWHWENLIPIPQLDPYLYDNNSACSQGKEESEKEAQQHTQKERIIGIDLRYNILHQKLSMVNCCIHRSIQQAKENGQKLEAKQRSDRPSFKRVGNLFDDVNVDRETKLSKLQSFIEKFVEGSEDATNSKLIEKESAESNTPEIEDDRSKTDQEQKEELEENDADDDDDSDVFVDAVDVSSFISKDSIAPEGINNKIDGEEIVPSFMQESFVHLPTFIPATAEELEAEEANAIKDPNAAEGIDYKHDTLKLLKTGQPMNIPITQEAGFMTEDMINEQAGVFESMGSSENATQQRAKLQSAQLYSDMQAFKAANPHACLEDFVRWHSPRDWIEEDDNTTAGGHLTARMSEPKNIWQELWKCSKRIPASRQKPLFNTNVEAEKALFFLETTSIHELFSIMLPTLGLIAYDTLSSHPVAYYSRHVSQGLVQLGDNLTSFPWHEFRYLYKRHFLFDYMRFLARSYFIGKLPGQYDLVDELLVKEEVRVRDGSERTAVFELFKNDHGVISGPAYREYILYSQCKDLSSDNGRCLPLKQYTIVKDNEIRITDMETTDALYS
ncbi:Rab3 GTPase-activating protein catalytic subunit-domain-containing protein [Mycotypha africana]|uniref:Rab3 GTPase-activating protein catalytic subunit-domain-containing protein n=1 Tax=Mycotypha africana TaxID=64632 RepID=UPI0023012B80|nr:Rab3 GTPase-activating protein catalytic subunit-domain-containing protein [Mycotypha africana]KAI8972007.1 Rab3 GTPase-activating protein catalytic subunit-domain-containing protein [Mycotypha africana]